MATPKPYDRASVAWLRAANMADSMALIYVQSVRLSNSLTVPRNPTWDLITTHQGNALAEIVKTLVPASEWDSLWNYLVSSGSVHQFTPQT